MTKQTPAPPPTMGMTSDDEKVVLPTPQTVIDALKMGIETYTGLNYTNGAFKESFNFQPLIPVHKRASKKALFDEEKIRQLVPTITSHPTPQVDKKVVIEESIDSYVIRQSSAFSMSQLGPLVKASLRYEFGENHTSKVMFTKKQKRADAGYLRPFIDSDLYDLLTQSAKDDLEGVNNKTKALEFYEEYGTHYISQVGMGASVDLTQSVVLKHQMTKEHIRVALDTEQLFTKIANGDLSGSVKISTGVGTEVSTQTMHVKTIGGKDPSKFVLEDADVISYKVESIYEIIEDDDTKVIMKDTYLELMTNYDALTPKFNADTYVIKWTWRNTDLNPLDNWELLELKLTLNGTLISEAEHKRKEANIWLKRVRGHEGSEFAKKKTGNFEFSSSHLTANSLDKDVQDLYGKL